MKFSKKTVLIFSILAIIFYWIYFYLHYGIPVYEYHEAFSCQSDNQCVSYIDNKCMNKEYANNFFSSLMSLVPEPKDHI